MWAEAGAWVNTGAKEFVRSTSHPQFELQIIGELVGPYPDQAAVRDLHARLARHAGTPGRRGLVQMREHRKCVVAFLGFRQRNEAVDGEWESIVRESGGRQLAMLADAHLLDVALADR